PHRWNQMTVLNCTVYDIPPLSAERYGALPGSAHAEPRPIRPFCPECRGIFGSHRGLGSPLHGDRHVGPVDLELPEADGLGSRSRPVPAGRFSPLERFGNYRVPP